MPPSPRSYPVHKHPPRHPSPITPDKSSAVHESDINTFFNVTHCILYIWLKTNKEFWVYPVRFSNNTVYGYGWNGSRWVSVTIPARKIETYY